MADRWPHLRTALLLAVAAGLLGPALVWLGASGLITTDAALAEALARHRATVLLLVAVQALVVAGLTLYALAQRFVAQRVNATPVAIAIIGPGIAAALAGYPIAGGLLVALGILFKRVIKWQAPKLLLHLASHQPAAYLDATSIGVMEVQRRG